MACSQENTHFIKINSVSVWMEWIKGKFKEQIGRRPRKASNVSRGCLSFILQASGAIGGLEART